MWVQNGVAAYLGCKSKKAAWEKSSASHGAHLGQLHGQLGKKCCSGRVNILAATGLRMAFQWPFPGAYCFPVGTRESYNLSCSYLCCSVTRFAACLCGPWGCALCDLSPSLCLLSKLSKVCSDRQSSAAVIPGLPSMSSGAKEGM